MGDVYVSCKWTVRRRLTWLCTVLLDVKCYMATVDGMHTGYGRCSTTVTDGESGEASVP